MYAVNYLFSLYNVLHNLRIFNIVINNKRTIHNCRVLQFNFKEKRNTKSYLREYNHYQFTYIWEFIFDAEMHVLSSVTQD